MDTSDDQAQQVISAPRKASRVRVLDAASAPNASRRGWLKFAAGGAVLPASSLMLGGCRPSHAGPQGADAAKQSRAASDAAARRRIARDFSDPYIELVRLLRESAEVEHSLMLQYLYAAFSVKPIYRGVAGHGAPNTNDLLGVAVQEMQHLGKVNQLLVALGAAPHLIREDFPYEQDIYPFRFNLEPLTRSSLAKYVWTEAPPDAMDPRKAKTQEERAFIGEVQRELGVGTRPNFVGSLYDTVISLVKEVAAGGEKGLPDMKPWIAHLKHIKDEGEDGHFKFFKRVFLGTHEGFKGQAQVWSRPASDAAYPSNPLPVNPTAYIGHDNQIANAEARGLAWLGNLHYWALLNLLQTGYSRGSQEHIALARGHMMGPFWSLARKLSSMGQGMPFDALSLGHAPGGTPEANARFMHRLLAEADRMEKQLVAVLPSDFPAGMCAGTMSALAEPRHKVALRDAPSVPWNDGLATALA
jgi:hypothetical protein